MKKNQYNRREFIKMMGTTAMAGVLATPLYSLAGFKDKTNSSGRKPNIIFILADDLGWVDTTVYGSKFYETPNVERPAQNLFRQWVSPV